MNLLKVTGVAIALIAGFYAPTLIKPLLTPSEPKPLDEYCVLSKTTCVQQDVSMKLSVDSAQPLVPAQITVHWPDTNAEQLVLSLAGQEMEMGQPKFLIKKVSSGKYMGEVILPVCTQESMTWVGKLSDGQNTLYPAIKMHR